jgi:hypothetical protein
MDNKITNFFTRLLNSKEPTLYNFRTLHLNDLNEEINYIQLLKNQEVDGFLIKNVFNKQEVHNLIKAYHDIDSDQKNVINSGLTIFPEPFSLLDQRSENSKENLTAYHLKAEKFWGAFPRTSKVDFVSKISMILKLMNHSIKPDIPRGVNNKGIYNPATYKEMSSDGGELKAHCGNYFKKEFGTFYSHLEETSLVDNQLSYFTMLQLPESGGELTLYNLKWKDVKIRLSGDTTLVGETGKKYNLLNHKQVKRVKIKPEPGDMILFSGGQIWHKVEFIEGPINRLTLGGFISFKKESDGLYFWS